MPAIKPKVTRVWSDVMPHDRRMELRVDFSNDRHHVVVVAFPQTADELAMALHQLAAQISRDPYLDGSKK